MAALLPALVLAPAARAQVEAGGRIVRLVGADTVPVSGAPVVLHRVGSREQGPLDTTLTDPAGRFRFRFRADTTAAFLLSTRFAGIEYFSRPIHPDHEAADTAVTLIVADTSSRQPVRVRQRTLLVSGADASGTRIVIDWLVLSNAGPATRVAADTLTPTWGGPLPEAAQNVEMADARLSQFAPEALAFRGDSVLLFAPLSPGDKELMLQYRIPGELARFVVPVSVADSVFVLLEEPGARVLSPDLVVADSQLIEGRSFRRWAGVPGSVATLEIALSGRSLSSAQILLLLVGLAALGFALLAARVIRGRRRASATPAPDPRGLAAAIAELDVRFADRRSELPPAEWEDYQRERARLKALLERALAPGGPGS
jgi:hypothetical protein